MKKLNLATALALSLAVPFSAQAFADEDVTIRVMEMHENTTEAVMKQIQLPDLAQDKVTDEGTFRYRNRKLSGQSTTPGDGDGQGTGNGYQGESGAANQYQGDVPSDGEGVGDMDRDRIQDQDRTREMEQDQDRIRDTDQITDHEPAREEQHIGEPESGPTDSNQQGPGAQG